MGKQVISIPQNQLKDIHKKEKKREKWKGRMVNFWHDSYPCSLLFFGKVIAFGLLFSRQVREMGVDRGIQEGGAAQQGEREKGANGCQVTWSSLTLDLVFV